MKLQGLVKVCAAMLFCLSNQQLLAQQLKLGTNPSVIKPSALLELESKKQALLITRIADTALITNPINGMIIYLESDNSFRVRANNYWTKLIPEGSAIKSINNDFTPTQTLAVNNTSAGTLGFTTPTAGTQTLTIPDAGLTAAGFVNIGAQSFKGLKNFTSGLQTANLRVVNDLSTPTKVLGKDVNGDVSALTLGTTLGIAAGTLSANNTTKMWNANKIADWDVLFSANPANGDVLSFNGTQWISKAPTAGGISSIGLTMPPMFTVTGSPLTANGTITATLAPQSPNVVFAGPSSGANAAPTFRPLVAADIPTLANYIQNTTTTQATSNFNISGAGVIGTTLTVKGLTAGSIPFIGTGGLLSENNAALSWNNATPKLSVTGTMRLTGSLSTPTNILGRDINGDINNVAVDNTTLAITTGTLAAKNGDPVWNAGQLQGRVIAATAPTDGQMLKWSTASSTFVPGDDITGGASYGDLADGDIMKAIAPDPTYRMKIWKGAFAKVINGPDTGPTGAFAWSTLAFQNTTGSNQFTTQLYFDKNTLALKEWKGINPLVENGNPWYKVVTTLGSNIFTVGGVTFANQTVDATTEVTQDAANLFWDNTAKELGIKTNAPTANLDVNGTAKIGVGGTILNGIFRATNQSTGTIATGVTSKTFTVTGAAIGGSVIVNPRGADFIASCVILSSRVSASNTVIVTFNNTSGGTVASKVLDLTVIQ